MKLTLNELRSLVKTAIKEEYGSGWFGYDDTADLQKAIGILDELIPETFFADSKEEVQMRKAIDYIKNYFKQHD